ncbi:hypothetical protein KC316_g52 [Hortaea werneckii]|nr:hypothetical protein KC316_g52 [Hortaea werneckii]
MRTMHVARAALPDSTIAALGSQKCRYIHMINITEPMEIAICGLGTGTPMKKGTRPIKHEVRGFSTFLVLCPLVQSRATCRVIWP